MLDKEVIKTYDNIEDYQILTDTGFEDISAIHKTIPFEIWNIKTDKHQLSGADNHILFDKDFNEIYIKDLKVGDLIKTKSGLEKVKSITKCNKKDNMYDLTIKNKNHRYYTNGILSHNSTSYTVYCLWYALMNIDKKILICANKFKTAKDILSRIKLAYEMLPNWMKPGIVTWNASEIEFSNRL